jgi:multidrug resistance efflux pump
VAKVGSCPDQARRQPQQARINLEQARINLEQARIDLEQARIDLEQATIDLEQATIDLGGPRPAAAHGCAERCHADDRRHPIERDKMTRVNRAGPSMVRRVERAARRHARSAPFQACATVQLADA